MAITDPTAAVGTTEASGLRPLPPHAGSSQEHSTASEDEKPRFQATTPLLMRLSFFLRAWSMKLIVSVFLRLMRISATIRQDRSTLPTYTKYYPVCSTLSNRVFIPRTHVSGKTHRLLISIHGGGFAICDPSVDDFFNRAMADEHDFVVVSVNYRKSPTHRFPVPVHDCTEITRAILADEDLPVDLSQKAALTGFSAGGNLVLAIAQLPGIKERIASVVPIYPVVDFTGKFKGPYRSTPDGQPDTLKKMGPVFNWAYIQPSQNLSDPLLSPICLPNGRAGLPRRLFFVGAEYDYLCHEAEIMARKLAFGKFETPKDEVGGLGDEWERDDVKWKNVKGVVHGWTHRPAKGKKAVLKMNELKKLEREIAEWLKQD